MNPFAALEQPFAARSSWTYNSDLQGYNRMAADKGAIDADLNLQESDETAARNEATAARQNQQAYQQRQSPRAGGSRYTRRGFWKAGGSGLNTANAKARTEARRQAAYAQKAKEYAGGGGGGGVVSMGLRPLDIVARTYQ